jgi:hypothetical protein
MNAEQKSRNAALAERLSSDPAFAEKWWAARRSSGALGKDQNTGTWADFAADNWRTTSNGDCEQDSQDLEVLEPEHERIDLVRVVAQALAFRPAATQADVAELTAVINRGYGGEQHSAVSGGGVSREEGFRTEPLIDEETVQAMVEDPSCEWLLVS